MGSLLHGLGQLEGEINMQAMALGDETILQMHFEMHAWRTVSEACLAGLRWLRFCSGGGGGGGGGEKKKRFGFWLQFRGVNRTETRYLQKPKKKKRKKKCVAVHRPRGLEAVSAAF